MGRDKFTLTDVRIRMVENGGWIAIQEQKPGYLDNFLCALTSKKELLQWLDDNLRYSTDQHETDGEKIDGSEDA